MSGIAYVNYNSNDDYNYNGDAIGNDNDDDDDNNNYKNTDDGDDDDGNDDRLITMYMPFLLLINWMLILTSTWGDRINPVQHSKYHAHWCPGVVMTSAPIILTKRCKIG